MSARPQVTTAEDDTARALLLDTLSLAARAGDLNLGSVLSQMVQGAARLVGARYGAIGLLDQASDRLGLFVHTGMDPGSEALIGGLPRGRGLLGALLTTVEPLRLQDLREHPTFTGFPAHHPQMTSFLGLPVALEGEAIGYLYLCDKIGAPEFSDEDEEAAVLIAAITAGRVREAREYELNQTRATWLAATLQISSTLVVAESPVDALGEVCDLARTVADADWARIQVSHDAGTPHQVWTSARSGCGGLGDLLDGDPSHRETAERVSREGEAARLKRGESADWVAVVVPLRTSTSSLGELTLAWLSENRMSFDLLPTELPASFAEQAAIALQIAESRANSKRIAVLEDRDRIALDLHDRVIQELFASTLSIEGVARRSSDPDVVERLSEAVAVLRSTSREIRRTIFALERPEEESDLGGALEHLIDRASSTLKLHPTLHLVGDLREVPPDVIGDLVAALAESLSNVARHAAADHLDVAVEVGERLQLTVTDDGVGTSGRTRGSGLDNLRERARRHGGGFDADGGPDARGTVLRWWVPLHPPGPSAGTPD